MQSLHGVLHGIEWIMFHDHLDYFQKPPLGGRPNTTPWDHGTPKSNKPLIYSILWCARTHVNKLAFGWGHGHIWLHNTLEGRWPRYIILEVSWDGLGSFSFGLPQLHGHGSWLKKTWKKTWPEVLGEFRNRCMRTYFCWILTPKGSITSFNRVAKLGGVGNVSGEKYYVKYC